MVKESFYFDSHDGKHRLHGVRYSPDEGQEVRCVLQIVHELRVMKEPMLCPIST